MQQDQLLNIENTIPDAYKDKSLFEGLKEELSRIQSDLDKSHTSDDGSLAFFFDACHTSYSKQQKKKSLACDFFSCKAEKKKITWHARKKWHEHEPILMHHKVHL